jgi:hypothetical protein
MKILHLLYESKGDYFGIGVDVLGGCTGLCSCLVRK